MASKIKSIVTGDAYDKPAKTADGAMTTQDSSDAHTVKDTSADPNPPPMEDTKAEKMLQNADKKVEEKSNKAQEMKEKAQDHPVGQKVQEGDLEGAAQTGKETAKERGQEEADSRRVT